jgi:transposase-like protein
MTYEKDYTISEELMEEVCEQGLDALPELMRIVLNAAMYIERQKHIGAGPYERTPERQGQANGFKPKTVATRMGKVTMAIPQVRDCDFYPSSLEKGIRYCWRTMQPWV